jgi:hypothetical protein
MNADRNSPALIETSSLSYEERLQSDPRWALAEGSRHFDEKSDVFAALRKITRRLDELHIPYAIVGGLALFQHGYRRFTEDVDLLVTSDSLKKIHKELDGLGYVPPHRQSKHLRDTELGVRIEFLVTGQFPGDGKPKPVAFPDPATAAVAIANLHYLNLETLIELKLASGISSVGRMRDLSDVMELIKVLNLPRSFSDRLNPFVREKYAELWKQARTRYVMTWRNKWLTAEASGIEDMIRELRNAADQLDQMRKDGVVLEEAGTPDDYAQLVTTDPEVAKKYDMLDESEYWEEDDESDSSTD